MLRFLLSIFLFVLVHEVAIGQDFAWVQFAQKDGTSITTGVAVDKNGNTYVTGTFQEKITLGEFTLEAAASFHISTFVAKINPNGQVLWLKGGIGPNARSFSVAVDKWGSCYITGYMYHQINFDGRIVGMHGDSDLFIVKYNSAGEVQWVTEKVEAYNYGKNVNIVVDETGNAYVAGIPLWKIGAYCLKLDPNGKLLWKKEFVNAVVARLALDEKQNSFYLAGKLVDNATINGINLTSAGGADIFVGKFDLEGNAKWVKRLGGSAMDSATGIVADGSGNTYISGVMQGSLVNSGMTLQSKGGTDGLVMKLKTDGTVDWARSIGSVTEDIAAGLTIDNKGRLFLTGTFTGQMQFMKKSYSATSPTGTLYVAEFGTTGTEKSFFTLSGEGRQQSRAISAGSNNDIAFGGALLGKVQFNTQRVETFKEQMFVAKLIFPEASETPDTPEEPQLPTTPPNAIAVRIPNIFTPNGDQQNDAFEILIDGAPESKIEITVYDRLGKQIYYQNNYKNNWTGKGLADSTYFYLVQVKAGDQVDSYKGWVEIVR